MDFPNPEEMFLGYTFALHQWRQHNRLNNVNWGEDALHHVCRAMVLMADQHHHQQEQEQQQQQQQEEAQVAEQEENFLELMQVGVPADLNPMSEALKWGELSEVRRLIEKEGFSPIAPIGGVAPLHAACQHGHWRIVAYLLDTCEVNVNSGPAISLTPLMIASANNHIECIRLLLQHGADCFRLAHGDFFVAGEYFPFLTAAMYGYVDQMKYLLESGDLDMNSLAEPGWDPLYYPLMRAIDCKQWESCRVLFDHGLNLQTRDVTEDWERSMHYRRAPPSLRIIGRRVRDQSKCVHRLARARAICLARPDIAEMNAEMKPAIAEMNAYFAEISPEYLQLNPSWGQRRVLCKLKAVAPPFLILRPILYKERGSEIMGFDMRRLPYVMTPKKTKQEVEAETKEEATKWAVLEYVLGQKRNIVGLSEEEKKEKEKEVMPLMYDELFRELMDYMVPIWDWKRREEEVGEVWGGGEQEGEEEAGEEEEGVVAQQAEA